jgi:hypothetical protein
MKICDSRACPFLCLPLNVIIEALGAFTCSSTTFSVAVVFYFNILFH